MISLENIKKEIIENGKIYEIGHYKTKSGDEIGHYKLFLKNENEEIKVVENEKNTPTIETLQKDIDNLKGMIDVVNNEVVATKVTSSDSQEFLIGVMENVAEVTEKIDSALEKEGTTK